MKLLNTLIDIVYPPNCVLCDEYSHGKVLCEKCSAKLELCRRKSGDKELEILSICPELSAVASPFVYDGAVKELILDMKRVFEERRCRMFAQNMLAVAREAFEPFGPTIVTCVPSSSEKIAKRGFNHAEKLGRAFAAEIGLPFLPDLLDISDDMLPQHTLSAELRRENAVKNILAATDYSLENQTIIIVDDICTTASTLGASAKVLMSRRAKSILAVTACIAEIG